MKIGLVRLLYERGYTRKQVVELFNIIDWVIQLPESLERGFAQKVQNIQEEKKMAYINTVQRVQLNDARQEGIEQGMLKGAAGTLQKLLKLKFGDLPSWVQQRLEQATPEQLDAWTGLVLTAESLEFMQVGC